MLLFVVQGPGGSCLEVGIPSPGDKETGEFENLFHLEQFWGAISLASLKVDLR